MHIWRGKRDSFQVVQQLDKETAHWKWWEAADNSYLASCLSLLRKARKLDVCDPRVALWFCHHDGEKMPRNPRKFYSNRLPGVFETDLMVIVCVCVLSCCNLWAKHDDRFPFYFVMQKMFDVAPCEDSYPKAQRLISNLKANDVDLDLLIHMIHVQDMGSDPGSTYYPLIKPLTPPLTHHVADSSEPFWTWKEKPTNPGIEVHLPRSQCSK